MTAIKQSLNIFPQSKNFPFFVLWVLFCLIYFLLPYVADDNFPRSLYAIESTEHMIAFLKMFYLKLGSRLLPHAAYLLLLKFRFLFLLISPAAVAWTAYLINYFFNPVSDKKISWFICSLIVIFPFWDLATSGYVLDTAIFWIPFTLMLFALIPLKNLLENKTPSNRQYFLYGLALIYGANTEQTAIMIFAILIVFMVAKSKEINFFVWIEFFIVSAILIFTFLTPGNYVRLADETFIWFRDFGTLSILKLTELGFSSTVYHYIYKPNAVFLMFFVLLSLLIWQVRKDFLPKILIGLIAIVVLFFGYLTDFARNAMTVYGYISPASALYNNAERFFYLALLIMVGIALIYLIWIAFKDEKQRLYCLFILALGFATRMTLMLSPTIWGSQTRTFIYLNFALMLSSIMLLKQLQKTQYAKWENFYIFTAILAGICFIFFMTHILNINDIPILSHLKYFVDSYLIPKYDMVGWEMAVVSIQKG